MSNVIALNHYRAAPEHQPFSITDSLAPHLFAPGRERNAAVYAALVLATAHASPVSHLPRDPQAALAKARRAVAILQIECAELARAQGGAA